MELSLMERFADPAYFGSLSMGERMAGAGVTALMGLGTTFLVLCLIWIILAIMGRIMDNKRKNDAANAAPAAAPAPKAAAPAPAKAAATDDAQLVAVISAAIAALEGTSTSNLVVRKITRVGGTSTAWSHAGSMDCLDSRNMTSKRK